jgi:hypothetical protein
MQRKVKFCARNLLHISVLVSSLGIAPLSFAQAGDAIANPADAQAREAWRAAMHQIGAPEEGCFHASYPSTLWERVECAPPPDWRSALPKPKKGLQTVGNGYDYVAQAASGHLLTSAIGSFPAVTGVTSEKSVGVPAFGDGGILGPNQYSLQVNTNFYSNSPACDGYSACFAWQQYVMATDWVSPDKAAVFIEYWLIDYGIHEGRNDRNICPSGFSDAGPYPGGPGDYCVQNTKATVIASGQLPITDLAGLTLSGSATPNGTDAATVTYGGEAYTATVSDNLTDIAIGWTQAEFNVFGNAGGSQADFNSGSSVTVKIMVTEGSTSAPTCVSPSNEDGTTGETNNLTLGTCTAAGGSTPSIEFTESN